MIKRYLLIFMLLVIFCGNSKSADWSNYYLRIAYSPLVIDSHEKFNESEIPGRYSMESISCLNIAMNLDMRIFGFNKDYHVLISPGIGILGSFIPVSSPTAVGNLPDTEYSNNSGGMALLGFDLPLALKLNYGAEYSDNKSDWFGAEIGFVARNYYLFNLKEFFTQWDINLGVLYKFSKKLSIRASYSIPLNHQQLDKITELTIHRIGISFRR